ncbi:unnamed protein product [Lactuca virosa]|uniref:Secreted protein n=1 Tax=Lactuca virosa TaxID=75947 RepID=A0AAU9N2J2_9ASTR|nr:unnamed protein product [Lactuca virosa]
MNLLLLFSILVILTGYWMWRDTSLQTLIPSLFTRFYKPLPSDFFSPTRGSIESCSRLWSGKIQLADILCISTQVMYIKQD